MYNDRTGFTLAASGWIILCFALSAVVVPARCMVEMSQADRLADILGD